MNLKNIDNYNQTEGRNPINLHIPRKTLRFQVFTLSNYLIKFSLFSFVFFAPVSISGEQISLGLGFLGWLFSTLTAPPNQKKKVFISRIGWAFIPFLIAGFLSVIRAEDKFAALYSFRSLWTFFAFLWAANWITSFPQLKHYLILMASVASIDSLIGVFQYFGGLQLGGHQLIPLQPSATGIHGISSMTYSGLTLVIFLFSAPTLIPKSIRLKDFFYVPLFVLPLLGVVFACQRGVWLGLIGGSIFLGAIKGKKTFFTVLLALVIGSAIIYKTQPYIRYRISIISQIDTKHPDNSLNERLLLWKTALAIAQEHPLTGTGINQFRKYAAEKILPLVDSSGLKVTLGHAHSNPLQILATMGVVGFLAFLWLWIEIFREGFRLLRRASPLQSLYITGVLSALCAFHIEGLSEYTFGDAEIITLVWFLVGGMIAVNRFGQTSSPTDQQTR